MHFDLFDWLSFLLRGHGSSIGVGTLAGRAQADVLADLALSIA